MEVYGSGHDGGVLIFDGDCGFCTASARWVGARLEGEHPVVPYQHIDPGDYGLSQHDVETAAYWVEDGTAHRGHRAIAASLRAIGGPWGIAGRVMDVPPLRWLAAGAYHLVAANRHRLPGSTPACRFEQPDTDR